MFIDWMFWLGVATTIVLAGALVMALMLMRRSLRHRRHWRCAAVVLGIVFAIGAAAAALAQMSPDWPFFLAGVLIGAGGCAIFSWALFADRARGRRRCPKCWYDMSKTDGLRCPECGRVAQRERRLHKTRRRWKLALTGFIPLLAAAFLAMQPKVQRDGWASVMPTTLLVFALYLEDNDWSFAALEERMSYEHPLVQGMPYFSLDNLWDWQRQLIGARCIKLIEGDEESPKRNTALTWMVEVMEVRPQADDELQQRMWGTLIGLLDDADIRMRTSAAIYSANRADPEGSINRLLPLLEDPDSQVRTAAVTGLRVLGLYSDAPLPYLLAALEHKDWQVRQFAAGAIGMMIRQQNASGDVLTPLMNSFEHDVEPKVRAQALSAISHFGPQHVKCMETIQRALIDPESTVRAAAIDALAAMEGVDPSMFVEPVLAGSIDESADVRVSAAWLLRYRVTTEALIDRRDVLQSLVASEDEEVRRAAAARLWDIDQRKAP